MTAEAGRTEVRVEGAARNVSIGTAEAVPSTLTDAEMGPTSGSRRSTIPAIVISACAGLACRDHVRSQEPRAKS
jgi:hypothetical protein